MGRASQRKKQSHIKLHQPQEPYSSAAERASEDDRLWFEAHPDETQRIRHYIAGELRDHVPPLDYKILVTQIRPGMRTRRAVSPDIVEAFELGITIFDTLALDAQELIESFEGTP